MPEKKIYGPSRGHVIDDDVIETLAAEAEAGYDITKLRRRGGRQLMGSALAEVVPVRLAPELRAEIERRAEAATPPQARSSEPRSANSSTSPDGQGVAARQSAGCPA